MKNISDFLIEDNAFENTVLKYGPFCYDLNLLMIWQALVICLAHPY